VTLLFDHSEELIVYSAPKQEREMNRQFLTFLFPGMLARLCVSPLTAHRIWGRTSEPNNPTRSSSSTAFVNVHLRLHRLDVRVSPEEIVGVVQPLEYGQARMVGTEDGLSRAFAGITLIICVNPFAGRGP
jgi:hypothetical protein